LLCTRLYKYAPNLESLLTQQYVCVMCTLWSEVRTKTKVNLGTCCSLKMSKNTNKRVTENYILKFLTVSSVSSDSIVKESLMTVSTRLWKLPKSTSKKQNIYNIWLINMMQSCQIKQRYNLIEYHADSELQIIFKTKG
jgi:hypothetical protein